MLLARPAFAVELLEEIVEQKYDVNPDATLSVENIDGAIRVYAADKPEIVIQAIKKAYNSERLQAIVVDVKASQSGVVITTRFPPRKNALSDRSGAVDYIIIVPQMARISDLKLTNGEILSAIDSFTHSLETTQTMMALEKREQCYRRLGLLVKAEQDKKMREEMARVSK